MTFDTPSLVERRSGNITLRPKDHRDPFQRDRARILHSAAFRRLQAKTQILGVGQHDFYRTRLTHSLEVAQIGTGITAQLKQVAASMVNTPLEAMIPSDALIESLCLAHDLGHPPFGHGGETALNFKMRNHGGFEANGQTFRILTHLEPYTKDLGMDLTRRTLLGLIEYPGFIRSKPDHKDQTPTDCHIKAKDWKPVKGLFLDDKDNYLWLMAGLSAQDAKTFNHRESVSSTDERPLVLDKSVYKSFDASIMELADDIAYGVHDLEDAIVLGRVNIESWRLHVLPVLVAIDNPWAQKHAEQLTSMLFSKEHHERKSAIGALVNHLITNIDIAAVPAEFEQPLLQYNAILKPAAAPILNILKQYVYRFVILATDIQQLEFRGQRMLMSLFDAFASDPERLLPQQVRETWLQADNEQSSSTRVICDYLASMSDQLAQRTFIDILGSHEI